ncbi:MAG: hypothetical protein D6820_10335 [Lentisphaerae bacterium]|nr:MAG: hypothetical protein D6820_10335 [Lentisphaerota bacterium]
MADEETVAADNENASEAQEHAGPGKGLILALVVTPVLMIIITPIIVLMMIKQLSPKLPTTVNAPGTKSKIIEIKLPKLQVNVAGTNGTRYAEIEAVVTVTDPSMKKYFEEQSDTNPDGKLRRMVAVINEIIGSKNLNELLSKEYRDRLKKEIRTALNDILKEDTNGMVHSVYFPRFLIQ